MADETTYNRVTYSHGAMLLHWVIALLLAFEISLGWRADDLPRDMRGALFALHKPIGITILLLTIIRILWRFTKRPPAYPATLQPWERTLADWTHKLFYFFLLAIPLSGWLMVSSGKQWTPINMFGLFSWPQFPGVAHNPTAHAIGETHGVLIWGVLILLALHIAGALKHQFIDRDPSNERMLPLARPMLGVGLIGALALIVAAIVYGKQVPLPAVPAPAATAPAAAPATPAVSAAPTAAAPAVAGQNAVIAHDDDEREDDGNRD